MMKSKAKRAKKLKDKIARATKELELVTKRSKISSKGKALKAAQNNPPKRKQLKTTATQTHDSHKRAAENTEKVELVSAHSKWRSHEFAKNARSEQG